ncbi:dihydroxyacetone kinase subunit L [Brachybacterium sp. P6-10-X1]|uniref:dihydroxyacetone kinase subunit DhaL n=1 Tax=Brachybacterium sp. P6-10-X1 TaxID=1903186 RepID=UPI00097178AF|nr:dihydroxyacetone kinase subunit DhaL [Brachybacterium sp. P6-10-X1]APX33644.1 dihydroxyacetone kinase subunit L [Brachybacterium sp. P6-10-X1]
MNDQTPSIPLPGGFGRAFVLTLREALVGAADDLGDLDRRAGDGDFGTNIRTAVKHLDANLEADDPTSYREWLTALYMAWLGVGGTSGPLFGMFFRELAKAAEDGNAPTAAQFADALAAGQATVQRYGEAKVGDKTMIDALDPAVAALRTTLEADVETTAVEALFAAEDAAIAAAAATAQTTARRGRASYVGDASQGVIDPGSAAMALVIGSARAGADGSGTVDLSWIA